MSIKIMNDEKAQIVQDMRNKRIDFGTIAKHLGVKRSTMQSYYYQWLKRP